MDRTQAANYTLINGKRTYQDRDLTKGIPGTSLIAADRNAVQEEIITCIEQSGQTPNAGNNTQLWQAIQLEIGNNSIKNAVTSSDFASVNLDTNFNGAVFKTRNGNNYAFPQSPLPSGTQLGINAIAFNIAAQQVVMADTNNNFHYYYSTTQIDSLLANKADFSFLKNNYISGQNTGANVSVTRIELAQSDNGGDDGPKAYLNVSTDTGKLVSVPTNSNVARQILDALNGLKTVYQPAGNYITQDIYRSDFNSGDNRVQIRAYGQMEVMDVVQCPKGATTITWNFPRAFSAPPFPSFTVQAGSYRGAKPEIIEVTNTYVKFVLTNNNQDNTLVTDPLPNGDKYINVWCRATGRQ